MKIRTMMLLAGLSSLGTPGLFGQEAEARPGPATAVVAPATAKVPPAQAQPAATASQAARAARPMSVTVLLDKDTKISGTLIDSRELPMRTAFGLLQIPLAEVAGIRMAGNGDTTTTVVLHNGDSVTGATELKMVQVETTWGKAEIIGSNIESIMFVPGMTWVPDTGLNGTRWKLADANAPKSVTVAKPPTGSPSPSSPSYISPSGTPIVGQPVYSNQVVYPSR